MLNIRGCFGWRGGGWGWWRSLENDIAVYVDAIVISQIRRKQENAVFLQCCNTPENSRQGVCLGDDCRHKSYYFTQKSLHILERNPDAEYFSRKKEKETRKTNSKSMGSTRQGIQRK